ncbi:MAG: PaaI family thioesterase [Solirubrobacterales bacterium]|nr:PaaI family thioesterase [Solirubrobacterales bacterium]
MDDPEALMPFLGLVGIELLSAEPSLVCGRLEHAPERCTAGGLMHGGALMALADSCGGMCAYLNLPEGAVGTSTIESKTNFLGAVREGAVSAVSKPLHVGASTIVVETELWRADGKLVGKTTQTQAVLHGRG